MTVRTVRMCDKCGNIINEDLDSSDSVQLTYVSGHRLTADLCVECFEHILKEMNITWSDVEEETIIPAEPEPEPVHIPEEPVSNPPSEDEGEEFEEEPEPEHFDASDEFLIAFLESKGKASITEIATAMGISNHDAVCMCERLRRKGEVKKAAGRYMWQVISHD